MPITHRNRKGDVYYLHEGVTKTGKPRYHFSRNDEGTLTDEIPAGYEIYEKPDNAQVYLRKVRPSPITPAERDFAETECRRLADNKAVLVDIEGDSLIVYTSDGVNERRVTEFAETYDMPLGNAREHLEWCAAGAPYMKMLRFTLVEEDQRLFSVDRWCFLGSIDDWFPVGGSLTLDHAVEHYAPHLFRESFFELMM